MFEYDPFSPTYYSQISKKSFKQKNGSRSTDILYKNLNTNNFRRSIVMDLFPESKHAVVFDREFDSETEANQIDFVYLVGISAMLTNILSKLKSISTLEDIKINKDEPSNLWRSSPSLLFYSRKSQDRHLYFTADSNSYIQFYMKHPNNTITLIGNVDGFENDNSFSRFVGEIMHNLGIKEQIKYQF